MPRIHYDTTPAAVTAWCECGWVELSLTPAGARRAAAEHQQQVHPRWGEADRLREARARRDQVAGDDLKDGP